MAFAHRRKYARSEQPVGTISRHAQRRVDRRVVEIMARRDAAERRDSPPEQASSARHFVQRQVARPS